MSWSKLPVSDVIEWGSSAFWARAKTTVSPAWIVWRAGV
jgi:hypothetical protein